MKTLVFLFLLMTAGFSHAFENLKKGDCIKISRKNPEAGVVFVIEKVNLNSIEVRGNYFILDASRLDTKVITRAQVIKYFKEVSCDQGI